MTASEGDAVLLRSTTYMVEEHAPAAPAMAGVTFN